jgi:hypothetical protein
MPRGEKLNDPNVRNGFEKNPDNINRNGRPKLLKNVVKDTFLQEFNVKLSHSQANEIISGILGMSRQQLMDYAKDENVPFWISMIAKKAQRDYERGSIHLIEVLMDRVYGKPKETIDSSITIPKAEISLGVVSSPTPLSDSEDAIVLD